MNDNLSVGSPLAKILTALGAAGISSWSEFASMLAALYTTCLIAEWLWKNFIRPAFIRRGIISGKSDGQL